MKIGLIGDHIIDDYVYGEVTRISPESPLPLLTELRKERRDGGSGNVYNNLKAFGLEVDYCRASDEQCSIKTRYVANGLVLFRSDNDKKATPIDGYVFDKDIKYVILSDYNKGILDNSQEVITSLQKQGKFIIVDPKRNLENFAGADIIKLNEREFNTLSNTGCPVASAKKYTKAALIITRAEKSILIATVDGQLHEIVNDSNTQVKDVTGAGDVFISALTYYISQGNNIVRATRKACKLASLSVSKTGTYTLTKDDIDSVNDRIVFTNGCFDILHKGHIDYLKKSKALGSRLIVGLNSDISVKRLKGESRPVNNQEDRKFLLETLQLADEVIIFDEDTPYNLIKRIRPDIITKGGDYTKDTVVGNDIAEVIIIPLVEGYSTTNIINQLNKH